MRMDASDDFARLEAEIRAETVAWLLNVVENDMPLGTNAPHLGRQDVALKDRIRNLRERARNYGAYSGAVTTGTAP